MTPAHEVSFCRRFIKAPLHLQQRLNTAPTSELRVLHAVLPTGQQPLLHSDQLLLQGHVLLQSTSQLLVQILLEHSSSIFKHTQILHVWCTSTMAHFKFPRNGMDSEKPYVVKTSQIFTFTSALCNMEIKIQTQTYPE